MQYHILAWKDLDGNHHEGYPDQGVTALLIQATDEKTVQIWWAYTADTGCASQLTDAWTEEDTKMETITTNNVPRDIIEAYELTEKEREEFDYLDWNAIDEGRDSASFFRYRGQLYDLGEFLSTRELLPWNPLRAWDGYMSDTYFSGMVVRYASDFEQVIVGRYFV